MFVCFIIFSFLVSFTLSKEDCKPLVKCYDIAAGLWGKCKKDFPGYLEKIRDPDSRNKDCEKSVEYYETKLVGQAIKKVKALANCLEDANKSYYCPTISARRRAGRNKRDANNDDFDFSNVEILTQWYGKPQTCVDAEIKEAECGAMREVVECQKILLCELCYERSFLGRAALDLEIENLRRTNGCHFDEEEDKK